MTRKERMLAAIRREPVDRIPVTTYNFCPYGGSRHAREPAYADLIELVVATTGMLCKASHTKSWAQSPDTLAVSSVARTETLTRVTRTIPTPKGDLTAVIDKPDDQPAYQTEPFIKTDEDIERYLSVDWVPGAIDLSAPVRVYQELGDRGLVYVGYHDPMHDAARLFDFEDFTIRCLTDLPAVLRLIDHLYERIEDQTRRLLDRCRGYDFLIYTAGPELATPPMMSPELFGALVTPYQQRLVAIIRDAGFPVSLHCHGRVRLVLDDILSCGFDMLEPIEPPPQGDISLQELLDRVAGRMTVTGHIQDQEFHTAGPGHFTRMVDDIAELVGQRTGYIMSPTCTPFQFPPTETFRRNYREWLEAAEARFGG